jgi:quercetin dioxygenase-like cupin family protein
VKQLNELLLSDIDIIHHFSSGVYAKDTRIPAGVTLTQHTHPFDHLSILASGTAIVTVDDMAETLTGPVCLTVVANKVHSVQAVTDVVWFCIHATDETDPNNVDMVILGRT